MRPMAQIGTMCNCTQCYRESKVELEEDAPPNVGFLQLLNEVGRGKGGPSYRGIETSER